MKSVISVRLFGFVATLGLVMAVGCGDRESESTSPPTCTPGDVVECQCTGDQTGHQECNDEGRFGPCDCPDDGQPDECTDDEDCADNRECVDGDCVEDDDNDENNDQDNDENNDDPGVDCDSGQLRCNATEDAVEVCSDDGTSWETEQSCDADYYCSEDYPEPTCTPAPQDYLEFTIGEDPASKLNDWDGYTGYAEYHPDEPEHLMIWLDDDEKLEHVLLELGQTPDSDLGIKVSQDHSFPLSGASGWAIRNVGVKGIPQSRGSHYTVSPSVGDPDGVGVIENVFADFREPTTDDGPEPNDTGYDGGWGWTASAHVGTIEVRHSFVAGSGDNAYYFENDYDQGTVHWEHCYHRDVTGQAYRTSLRDSTVVDSIAVYYDPDGTRGGYGPAEGNIGTGRAFWHRGHPHEEGDPPRLENLQVYFNPDHLLDRDGDYVPVWESNMGGVVWGSYQSWIGEYGSVDIVGGTINSEWMEHDGTDDPNDAFVYRHYDDFEFNFIEDVTEGMPDPTILGEGVPYTPEMAAAGERGLPPDPFEPAPGGGVPGDSTN